MNGIRVRFFATLREQTGREHMELSSEDVVDIATLWRRLQGSLAPDAITALRARGVRIAVNQELIEHDAPLRAGDEVAFLPPITGG
jgi:molybdopterin converting factor subunit 1